MLWFFLIVNHFLYSCHGRLFFMAGSVVLADTLLYLFFLHQWEIWFLLSIPLLISIC